jgi:sigma-B regulation protein RsbU (phosphoserine phosphatase)
MAETRLAPILVCAGQAATAEEVRRALLPVGCTTEVHLPGTPEPAKVGSYRLVVLDGSGGAAHTLDLCRRLRVGSEDGFVPLLFITDDCDPLTRQKALEAGADACLQRPLAPGELAAQVQVLLRIRDAHDALAGRAAEVHRVNTQLRQLHQQLEHELKLAQRIQESLLPQVLPQVPNMRFSVHYVLRDRVGGDFYDAFRLDEQHVGLYVADAMGHGVPASLLTIFVKKGVRSKEVFGKQYRLVPPDEVLRRLNRDLIDLDLPENPFITMVYMLLNHRTGLLSFARAGHPYPLFVPAEGPLELWNQQGLLLGVVDAFFPARTCRLRSGDKLLLYSDGIDSARFEDLAEGTASLLGCAERHRSLPAEEFIAHLASDLFGGNTPPDDLTLFCLEAREETPLSPGGRGVWGEGETARRPNSIGPAQPAGDGGGEAGVGQ